MASQADSAAHFDARAQEYGVTPALRRALANNGITTLAHLAFAINRPGADFNEAQFDAWAQRVNNGQAPA